MLVTLLSSLVIGTGVGASSSSVPTGLSVTAADGRVTVSFTEPDLTPASASPTQSDTRLGYTINVYQGATKLGATDACLNGVTASESCVVTNYLRTAGGNATLENGVTYTFRVIARWSDGNSEVQSGESVASSQATPFTSPSKPAAPTGTVNSTTSTSVDVSWVAPSDNGESIDLYTVTVWNKLGTSQITANTGCTSSTLTCTVTGLTLGSAYTFKVKANNSAGDSTSSDVSNAVTIVPGVATSIASVITTANDGTTSVKITWASPVVNDEAITEYTVTATADTTTVNKTTTGALEATFTADISGGDLVIGTEYLVKVKAKNIGGYGAYTSTTAVTPSRAPGAPTTIAATFSGRTAAVTWAAPTSDGGNAITEYTGAAFASAATDTTGTALGTCTSSGALTCSIPDLVAGTGYKFAVKAKNNANGYGAFSVLSSTATAQAITAPGAPTTVAATFSGRTAAVTWVAPTSNGGDAITEYTGAAFASTATDTTGTALGTCTSTGALTCSIPNLVAGTGYKFAVKAKNNANGYGIYSSLSGVVTAPAVQVTTTTTTVPAVTTTIAATTTTTAPSVPADTSSVVSTTTPVYSNKATPVTVSSAKLSAASGTQVSISRAPAASVIKEIEVAVSSRKVSMYVATPTSSNTKTAIVKYVIELRPASGASIKKTVAVKSAQVIKPNLTGKSKTTYTVVIVAYQKSGRAITWKGPKVIIK
ncbi:unannotated protein [freshwater metagenome]|uniref:Unannotated protein n=1 Tax=freshwater metagenome TaxID=449393 RepID=A0A6J6HEI5_9ZZZZ